MTKEIMGENNYVKTNIYLISFLSFSRFSCSFISFDTVIYFIIVISDVRQMFKYKIY